MDNKDNLTPHEAYYQLKAEIDALKIITGRLFGLVAGFLAASEDHERIQASIVAHAKDMMARVEGAIIDIPCGGDNRLALEQRVHDQMIAAARSIVRVPEVHG